METRDGAAGGDEFISRLRAKADKVAALAVKKQAEEMSSYRGAGVAFWLDHEEMLYGTRTGNVTAKEIKPGAAEWMTLDQRYAWAAQVFEPYTSLVDPGGLDPLITATEETRKVFGADPRGGKGEPEFSGTAWGDLNSTSVWLLSWYGEAATQFAQFSDPFKVIGNNHAAIAEVLRRGAVATARLFESARRDVLQIADATIGALEGLFAGDGADLAFALSVASALAGLIAAIPTDGASLAISFSLLSGAASTAKDALPADRSEEAKVEVVIGGYRVDDILRSMAHELGRFNRTTDEGVQEIKRILEDNLDVITNPKHRKEVVTPRPQLADLTNDRIRSDFSPPR